MAKKHAASMEINGVQIEVQAILVPNHRDDTCPDISAEPVVLDSLSWDATEVERIANEISQKYGCRRGEKSDALWCLSKMDTASRIFREARTAAARTAQHRKDARQYSRDLS